MGPKTWVAAWGARLLIPRITNQWNRLRKGLIPDSLQEQIRHLWERRCCSFLPEEWQPDKVTSWILPSTDFGDESRWGMWGCYLQNCGDNQRVAGSNPSSWESPVSSCALCDLCSGWGCSSDVNLSWQSRLSFLCGRMGRSWGEELFCKWKCHVVL